MFKSERQKIMSLVTGGIYLFLLVWLIVFKFNVNFAEMDHIRHLNLIPFKGSMLVNGKIHIKEIIYNIIVFIPLGVYVGIFKNDWIFVKKIFPALFLSILFEILQFIFAIGASDITDIIGNTLGGIIGIGCYALFKKLFRSKTILIINIIGLVIEVLAIFILAMLLVANM